MPWLLQMTPTSSVVNGDPSQVTVEGSNSHEMACVVDGRVMDESRTGNTKDFMVTIAMPLLLIVCLMRGTKMASEIGVTSLK